MEDELTRRLRALGDQPVPPATSAAHLAAMASVGARPERRRFGRVAVGLAALTGFLVGGSGLAMAGALPAPAQDAAASVLAQVGVVAPRSPSSAYGQCVSAASKAHGGADAEPEEVDNSAFRDAKAACKAEHPKGSKAHGPKEGKGPQANPKANDGDPCTGPPPWAGRMTPAEKAAAKAEHEPARAPCPPDEDEG